jgi:membrane associated rhomboid family serine protease
MIIPWGTDAPIYHRPVATIALIVINTLVFFAFPSHDYKEWALELGAGVHPFQWITACFMHIGFEHLFENMIFLWAFGIIVEGKLGWWLFTLVYLGIGVVAHALLQFTIHPEEPAVMAGASGVIFGLLAMCLVWAPRNDLQFIAFFRLFPMDFEFPILWVAAFYIGLELLEVGVRGFKPSSALGHATGAATGFVLGTAMLKLKLVDCEGWDLYAVMARRQGDKPGERKVKAKSKARAQRAASEFARAAAASKPKRKTKGAGKAVKSIEDASGDALRTLRLHLELGETEAALAVYKQSINSISGWQPPDRDWVDLITAGLEQNRWAEAARVMRDYVERAESPSPRVRLKLAQILIQKLGRPQQGLRILEKLNAEELPESLRPTRAQLEKQAEDLREDGELELQDEMW